MPGDLLKVYREAFGIAFANEKYMAEARKRNITIVEPVVGDAFTKVMEKNQEIAQELLQLFIDGGYIKK